MTKTNKKRNNKGFSLVELIIVIAIMAVLVGVLAPQFLGYVKKSKRSTDIKNAQEIASELAIKIAETETTGTVTDEVENWSVIPTSGDISISSVPQVKAAVTNGQFVYKIDSNYVVHVGVAPVTESTVGTAVELYPNLNESYGS